MTSALLTQMEGQVIALEMSATVLFANRIRRLDRAAHLRIVEGYRADFIQSLDQVILSRSDYDDLRRAAATRAINALCDNVLLQLQAS